MNSRTTRRVAVAMSSVVATAGLMALPANATTLAPSRITAHPSDTTPAAGETFRVRGAVWSEGVRVPATIRMKDWENGQWVQLKGAVMHTNRDNRYVMRVILHLKGERQLRAVGVPDSATISTARTTFSVTVH